MPKELKFQHDEVTASRINGKAIVDPFLTLKASCLRKCRLDGLQPLKRRNRKRFLFPEEPKDETPDRMLALFHSTSLSGISVLKPPKSMFGFKVSK